MIRIFQFLRRRKLDRELADEMHEHFEESVEDLVASGLSRREAISATHRRFGNATLYRELSRERWGWAAWDRLIQDLRFALRLFARSPGFTATAVLALTLGIGANTAIFSLLHAIVLRPLPVPHPEQLAQFRHTAERSTNSWFPYPHFERLREESQTLAGIFATSGIGRLNAEIQNRAELATRLLASGDYFAVLGVYPAFGRLLTAEDDRLANPVAVVSYDFWRNRMNADPAAVGRTIHLNQKPFTVVGVTPRGFFGITVGEPPDITLPLRAGEILASRRLPFDEPFNTWIQLMGRLKPDITPQQAQAELDLIFRRFSMEVVSRQDAEHQDGARHYAEQVHLAVTLSPGGTNGRLRHNFGDPLALLMAVVGVVLLIACADVANLFAARAAARTREMALRAAIGAGRARLVRQILTESTVLALAGGILGLAAAYGGCRVLLRMVSTGPALAPLDLTPDLRVLGFTLAVSLATGILFGIAPAIRASRAELRPALVRHPLRGGRLLLVSQVALSLVLFHVAGVFVHSLRNLWTLDPGYDRGNVLLLSINPNLAGYKGPQTIEIWRRLLDTMQSIPMVESASASVVRPVDTEADHINIVTAIDGQRLDSKTHIPVSTNSLAPGYFATMRTSILLGREFGPHDDAAAPGIAVINETLARRCFPGLNPIGRRITTAERQLEIAGVVQDSRYANLARTPIGAVYTPLWQQKGGGAASFELRYRGRLDPLLEQVRMRISEIDRSLASTVFRHWRHRRKNRWCASVWSRPFRACSRSSHCC